MEAKNSNDSSKSPPKFYKCHLHSPTVMKIMILQKRVRKNKGTISKSYRRFLRMKGDSGMVIVLKKVVRSKMMVIL